MKNIRLIIVPLMLIVTEACTYDKPFGNEAEEIEELTVSMADFVPEPETKVAVSVANNIMHVEWLDSDEIGIFPDMGGYQLGFSLNGQGGSSRASFTGGGWALKADARYAAYYPFDFDNKDRTSIPVDYRGQVQNGNGNTDHLGRYTFAASAPTASVNGAVAFSMEQVGTLVHFIVKLPDPATYTELALVSEAGADMFTLSGEYSLEQDSELAVTPKKKSNAMVLTLMNVTTTTANELVNAFMMVAPTDLTGHSLKIYAKTSENEYYSLDWEYYKFRKGAYKIVDPETPLQKTDSDVGFNVEATGEPISGGEEW